MPDARYGANAPITFRMGGMQVEALYYGADLIWPAGHIISIPADEITWTDYAPLILSGVHVRVPVDVLSWQDFEPGIELDGITVPVDRLDWTDYAPSVSSGAHVVVPLDAMQWADFAPVVVTSAIVDMPLDALAWVDYAPTVSAGASVSLPFDTMEWADFTPLVSAGASVSLPVDAWEWGDYSPNLGYAFSKAFSSAFNAVPHDYGVAVPVDGWGWSDFAPEVDAMASVDLSYVETISDTGSIDIGDPHTARRVYIIIHAERGDEGQSLILQSASIAGVSATIHAQSNGPIYFSRSNISLISAMVPVGASAAVSASYNRSGVTRRQMTSYRAIGVQNEEAIDFATVAVNNMGSSISRSLDVESGGFSIASLFTRNSNGQINSPNMTRDNRTALSDFNYNAFSSEEETTATDKTFTLTNSNGSGIMVALIATFR